MTLDSLLLGHRVVFGEGLSFLLKTDQLPRGALRHGLGDAIGVLPPDRDPLALPRRPRWYTVSSAPVAPSNGDGQAGRL